MSPEPLRGAGDDPAVFRKTLGKFLTGVTVVTTRDREGKRWGMTANSFSSVSLDPPLVSVCIANRAASYPAFLSAGHFGISILSAGQQDVAMRFAKPFEDKFEGLPFKEPAPGSLVLEGSAATLACRTHAVVPAGDHIVLLGHVLECAVDDVPVLGYSEGRLFDMEAPSEAGTRVPRPGREVDFGWLIESEGRLLLRRDDATSRWAIPMGPLGGGSTMSESMARTALSVLGVEVEPVFLYSTFDLDEDRTCYVYRARALDGLPEGPSWRLFSEGEMPWSELLHERAVPMLRRYFEESADAQFGIFLNLGPGRIARLADETAWSERVRAREGDH